jgi:hypothetical protein
MNTEERPRANFSVRIWDIRGGRWLAGEPSIWGDFSGARMSINASLDRRREGDRATADRNRIPSDKGNK